MMLLSDQTKFQKKNSKSLSTKSNFLYVASCRSCVTFEGKSLDLMHSDNQDNTHEKRTTETTTKMKNNLKKTFEKRDNFADCIRCLLLCLSCTLQTLLSVAQLTSDPHT